MTYQIVYRNGLQGIYCKICRRVSFHPKDVEHKYCAECKQFHDMMEIHNELQEHSILPKQQS